MTDGQEKSVINDTSYISIQAFMVNDLHLSGNELIVYAVIFGFSHDGASWYSGSRKYLAAWCQTSEKSVTNNLKKLLEKGLIEKRSRIEHGCTFNDYRAIILAIGRGEETSTRGKKVPSTGEESSPSTGEESSPHILEVDKSSGYSSSCIKAIIDYFNERVGTHYTYRNKEVNGFINARLREGFSVEDFKTVIDNKVASWKGTKWEEFLRPKTLFAPSHFEDYLNERRRKEVRERDYSAYDAAFYGS